jgi:hypothetical protein
VSRRLLIARPSNPLCAESQRACVERQALSQLMCAGNRSLLRVGTYIIVRRYTYWCTLAASWQSDLVPDPEAGKTGDLKPCRGVTR